jgi:hypothetical protein
MAQMLAPGRWKGTGPWAGESGPGAAGGWWWWVHRWAGAYSGGGVGAAGLPVDGRAGPQSVGGVGVADLAVDGVHCLQGCLAQLEVEGADVLLELLQRRGP